MGLHSRGGWCSMQRDSQNLIDGQQMRSLR
jgi:hypothetical protein